MHGARGGAPAPHCPRLPRGRGPRPPLQRLTSGTDTGGPGRVAWPRTFLGIRFPQSRFTQEHRNMHRNTHALLEKRFLQNQTCNFCAHIHTYAGSNTPRKLSPPSRTEAHTQLSHDPLRRYTMKKKPVVPSWGTSTLDPIPLTTLRGTAGSIHLPPSGEK